MTRRRILTIGVLIELLLLGALIVVTFAQQPPQSCEEVRDALQVKNIILQNSRTRTEDDLSQIAAALQKAQARIADLEKQLPKPAAKDTPHTTTTTTLPAAKNVK